jgi:hypothetical protein
LLSRRPATATPERISNPNDVEVFSLRLIAEGGAFANTPEDFAAWVKTEEHKWSAFVKTTGMSIQ